MRAVVSERKFVASEQLIRAVELCRNMRIHLPAIWKKDTEEDELVLTDDLMHCRGETFFIFCPIRRHF